MCPYFSREHSWKLTTQAFGCKHTREKQNAMHTGYAFFPFQGPAMMKDSTNECMLMREIEANETGSAMQQNESQPKCAATYFGRILGISRN